MWFKLNLSRAEISTEKNSSFNFIEHLEKSMVLGNIMLVTITIFDATNTDWNHYGTSDYQVMIIDETVLSTITLILKQSFLRL